MRDSLRKRLLATTVLAGAIASGAAYAQPADEKETEIVVTGTLIQDPNIVSSVPVAAVGEDEITLRQSLQAEEVLRNIPGAVPSIGSNVNNGNGGQSFVNLRGLGSQRNITLLDGARIVPGDTNGRVDLNTIPLSLIQRVDVLTGGASTTYGADAVSGVVNFVTKSDFSGVELNGGYGVSQKSDATNFGADITVGGNFADDRGNAVVSVGYQHADPVYQGDRDFSLFTINSTNGVASGSSPTSVPTSITLGTANFQVNPAGTLLVTPYLGFNFNPYNVFVTPYERLNLFASGRYEVSDQIEFYTRGMFTKNQVQTVIAPSGIFGEALTIPANNPYLPAGIRDQLCTAAGIALGAPCNTNAAIPIAAAYRRSTELGPRISTYDSTVFDYRAGFRGDLTNTLRYDVYGAYGESNNTETRSGYVSRTRVQQALNATNTTTCTVTTGGCVPLNLFGQDGSITPAQAAYVGGITSSTARKATLAQVHGVISGELGNFTWSSKPANFAVGGEWRKYTAAIEPDSLAQVPGELGGAGGAVLPTKGSYSVKEVFGEVNVPLVSDRPFFNDLSVEAGVRNSWYNIVAPGNPSFSALTWKAGLSWAPVPDLRFRANYQKAVRAPNIADLFAPSVTGLTSLAIDPCAGAAPVGNANLTAVCIAQGAPPASIGTIQNPAANQANSTGGGNSNLKPEIANSLTVGFVLTPAALENLTLTVDYYDIVVNDAITSPTPGDIIAACFGNITAASATNPACTSIRRNPTSGRLSGSVATTPGLPTPLTNAGRLYTNGFDWTIGYSHELGFAKLALSMNGNYTLNSKFAASATALNRECTGYYSANCGSIQPTYQWNQRTTLTFPGFAIVDSWDLSVLWRHLAPAKYEPGLPALFTGAVTNGAGAAGYVLGGRQVNFNRISAYNYIDLATQFRTNKAVSFTFVVSNLLDKEPPLLGGNASTTSFNSGNTLPSSYDTVGRRFSAQAKIRF